MLPSPTQSVARWARAGVLGLAVAAICVAPIQRADAQQDAIVQAKSLSRAFRHAAGKASPSVVTIIAKSSPSSDEKIPQRVRQLLADLPDGATRQTSQVGSGVIISKDGVIMTNHHVVQNATSVTVRFPDGAETRADQILGDEASDIAVLRVRAPRELAAAKLADSDKLEIGDWVIAIGSPFELETTVSAGIISGKGRGINKVQRGQLLQTDAAINPGNSGGPLVNLDGEVVGINTAIASVNGGYQGIGFVIPANRAKWVADELLKHGKVRRAFLGIRIADIDASLGSRLGVPARSGVWDYHVVASGPAAQAGVEEGDVITQFAGRNIHSKRDLQDTVEQRPIGSKQRVVIRRGKGNFTADVVLRSHAQLER